ncbi:MAG: SAM-dependent methyltransferase [Candidatus Dormiibacterota bacterium]
MTLALTYFEELYAADPDPWNFETRWYEHRKHELSVAALPRQKYATALELACANGRLTELLAVRCGDLLAVDAIASPVDRARERLARFSHVRVEQRQLPQQWPEGKFDLIVVSELLYYFDEGELASVVSLLQASLEPEGTLLAVHWRNVVAEYPLTGDAVHKALGARVGLGLLAHHEEDDFLLDVLVKYDGPNRPPSVAMASLVEGAEGSP